jgi:DNA polymerase I-like protein with 3'-5' exonuclease and polymerase domains
MSREIVVLDTEFGFEGGRVRCAPALVPVVACAFVLSSEQEHKFLLGKGGCFGEFVAAYRDALWVGHAITAEMKILLRLETMMPTRWYDTYLAERWLTNVSRPTPEAGLEASLQRRGLGHLIPPGKEKFRERILHLDFDLEDPEALDEIAEYCLLDCRATAALYEAQKDELRGDHRLDDCMTWWPGFQLAVALTERRGIPFDVGAYQAVLTHWPTIRERIIAEANAVAPVMRSSGIVLEAFVQWCLDNEIPPPEVYDRKIRGPRFSVANDALKEIEHHHPFIAKARQDQKTLKMFKKNTMVVDAVNGRHYFDIVPFRTITGRNAPKGFLFNAPKWMRFLAVPESPDHALVYVDYKAQEIGIAAHLSGDPAMQEMYRAKDPHLHFAIEAGAAPADATKETRSKIRAMCKTVNLAVLYGQTPAGIARQLAVSEVEAKNLLDQHKRLYPVFWNWAEQMVPSVSLAGEVQTRQFWRCAVGFNSKERTWQNWPMQAAGADIMRLTMLYFDLAGLVLLAPIHDGFLLSCRKDEFPRVEATIREACADAVEHVLPGFPLRVDVEKHEVRFEDGDPDAKAMWLRVQGWLREAEGL